MEGSSRCASLLLDWNVGAPRFPNEKEGPVVQKSYISFKIGISFKKLTITVFLLKSACDEGLHRKPGKNYVCECENRHHQRFEYEISIAGIRSQIKENGGKGAPFWLPKSLAIQCQCEFGTLGTTTKVKVVSLVMRVIVCSTKKLVESIFALSTSTNRD